MPCGAVAAVYQRALPHEHVSSACQCSAYCCVHLAGRAHCACTRSALSCQDAVSHASPSSALFSTSVPAAVANHVSLVTLQKELKEIERDKASGVSIHVKSGGNLTALTGFVEGDCCLAPCFCLLLSDGQQHAGPAMHLLKCAGSQHTLDRPRHHQPGIEREGWCAGPKDTAYEGGLFVVDIQLGQRCFTDSTCTETSSSAWYACVVSAWRCVATPSHTCQHCLNA